MQTLTRQEKANRWKEAEFRYRFFVYQQHPYVVPTVSSWISL